MSSVAHQLLAMMDLEDHTTWPDTRIGSLLTACKFIIGAESRNQGVSKQLLEMVGRLVPAEERIVRIPPDLIPKAVQVSMRLLAGDQFDGRGGNRLAEAGAAFRESVKQAIDRRDVTTARHHKAQQAKNAKKGTDAHRKYTDADREKWQQLAELPEIARLSSKRARAIQIAKRLQLPNAAVETIRKRIK